MASSSGGSEGAKRRRKPVPGASVGTGRTTPKGTTPGGKVAPASDRYTPPTQKLDMPSPRWVPILMFTLLIAGAAMIVLNYLGVLPTANDEPSNWWLLGGLGLISAGFIAATQYR